MRKYYTHIVLIILTLILYFMANFQRVAIPGAVFDTLQADLKLNAPAITNLSAVFMYSYAISVLFCGALADRFGAIKVIMCGAILFSVGSLIFPNTSNIYLLYLSRAILGIGAATFYLCLMLEAKKCFPDKYFSINVSLMLIIGYIGGFCANMPFVLLTKILQWKSILNILAAITAVVTIIYCGCRIFLKHIHINEHAVFSVAPYKDVLSKKFNRNLFIFAGLNYGLYYVIQTVIGVKFLKDYVEISSHNAAAILSLMIVVAGISGFSLASLSTKLKNKRVFFMKAVCIMTSSIFALISVLLFLNIKMKLIAILFLMIAIAGGMSPLLVPLVSATNKYEERGTAISIMNCCFFLSVGVLGTLTGILLDIFEPTIIAQRVVYHTNSYLLVFLTFFVISLIEMYNVFKLKDA